MMIVAQTSTAYCMQRCFACSAAGQQLTITRIAVPKGWPHQAGHQSNPWQPQATLHYQSRCRW